MLAVIAPPGDQLYVPPVIEGMAVSVPLLPRQAVSFGTDTVGGGPMITLPEFVAVPQPATVYVTV